MRDSSLLIVITLGAVLVNFCSGIPQSFERNTEDEPLRMATDSLVVKSFREEEEPEPNNEEYEYQTYQGVMGRPGIDFPVYRHIPATSFNCRNVKRPGYYADLDTDCQVFHICEGGRKISFLCPNGTIFRQSHLICDWWFRVDCGKSVELYEESAEQLAADQKIYRARSQERERRLKEYRATSTTAKYEEEDPSEGEVYALDEPYDARSRPKPTQYRNDKRPSGERHSKKVHDNRFQNNYRKDYKSTEDVSVNFSRTKPARVPIGRNHNSQPATQNYDTQQTNYNRQRFSNEPSTYNQDVTYETTNPDAGTYTDPGVTSGFETSRSHTPAPIVYTTQNYRTRVPTENAFRFTHENIQQAESGSLVGNFRKNNVIQFEAKLSEFSVRNPTTTEAPKTTTEAFREQYFTTARTEVPFYETTVRNHDPPLWQNTISPTAYFSTEKYQSTESNKYLPTTERPYSTTTPPSVEYQTQAAIATTSYSYNKDLRTDFQQSTAAPEEAPTATERASSNVYLTTTFEDVNTEAPTTPRIDISLHAVTINKDVVPPKVEINTYEDAVRDGLEVPPSSGPNALRSFALYFASKGSEQEDKEKDEVLKDLFSIPTVKDVEQKLSVYDDKAKEIVKKVDVIIQEHEPPKLEVSAADELPNSLTKQTRDSYSKLFDKNETLSERRESAVTEAEFGTTALEDFTEDAEKINLELKKNDLEISQSRGLVETDSNGNRLNDEFSKVSPDLRELAQVFTKALSAYLDDPEAFRRILSEIRPTEPTVKEEPTTSHVDYPSVTQEEDEVLDFSDVTKASRRKTTTLAFTETTEYPTEIPTTTNDLDNLVLPQNQNQTFVKIPSEDLTAPILESLDQSQSSYYTPPPNVVATTNSIAEEINSEFSGDDKLPDINSNEAVDTYLPIRGSVDDESRPRYGGFQNNTKTTKYSPYGADLTTKTYETTTEKVTRSTAGDKPTTFNPRNISSSIYFRKRLEAVIKDKPGQQGQLAKQLNGLAHPKTLIIVPPLPEYKAVRLGNGETLERVRPADNFAEVPSTTEPLRPREPSIELVPPFDANPALGYYEFDASLSPAQEREEYQTTPIVPTTAEPEPLSETVPPVTTVPFDFVRITTEEITTISPTTEMPKSFERIAELQQTLMFHTDHGTDQQMEKARVTVAEAMDETNMTDSTADTLMKVMEMAAKNETYRRLVLLLVNDKSGRNKTVEETRLALLRALLTPVISTARTRQPEYTTTVAPTEASTFRRRGNLRRSKSISTVSAGNEFRTTSESPRPKVGRRGRVVSRVVKPTQTTTTTTRIGNLEQVRRTLDSSKVKDVKTNSLEDAILESDSRAVELLRSLYSLAARWG